MPKLAKYAITTASGPVIKRDMSTAGTPTSTVSGLTLGEAKPETVEVGVPAVLMSRLITGPLAVVIAYFASFGMYE